MQWSLLITFCLLWPVFLTACTWPQPCKATPLDDRPSRETLFGVEFKGLAALLKDGVRGPSTWGGIFFLTFLRTAIPYIKFPVRFQSILSNYILLNTIYICILTLFKGIRQSSEEKFKVFIKKSQDCDKLR